MPFKRRVAHDSQKYEDFNNEIKMSRDKEVKRAYKKAFEFAMKCFWAEIDDIPTARLSDTEVKAFSIFYKVV